MALCLSASRGVTMYGAKLAPLPPPTANVPFQRRVNELIPKNGKCRKRTRLLTLQLLFVEPHALVPRTLSVASLPCQYSKQSQQRGTIDNEYTIPRTAILRGFFKGRPPMFLRRVTLELPISLMSSAVAGWRTSLKPVVPLKIGGPSTFCSNSRH